MEREQEITKLVNVLRRTARIAFQPHLMDADGDVPKYCVNQYNRIFKRLKEIDSGVGSIFDELEENASLTVAAIACRQLAAYYEDEVGASSDSGFDKEGFKNFWNKGAFDFQDLGEVVREGIQHWAEHHSPRHGTQHASSDKRRKKQ